ncbi:DUF4412 domain-containing protein [Mucilaginibacter limnophilus]|uniref:DUF4412 domain-containing protein n=1 Tax=Mucilaginibacter limnophilus TaxID=1932778 RepID=A0A437MTY3_9SPHI|nr:DUF4412 domain-containing protein [Mucilaginibacter limnophilus]RVU01050.1 DUF4412 domain-containing protein [Mucilaginibacter limnophilus]
MNSTIFKTAFCLAFSAFALTASAQKTYTEGVITYSVNSPQGEIEAKTYFRGDSSLYSAQQGPADIKIITTKAGNYLAVLVDVPVANMRKAAIATPAEIEEGKAEQPKFTFTPTTETKEISGFKCKKVTVKDPKSGSNFDAWVTNDITVPPGMLTKLFEGAGGVPVQFTTVQMGAAINVTLKTIAADKVPAGTFGIPAGFDRMTLTELKSMGGN